MNTKLRRIAKDTKALSPVVASIILIAVTVAVSIAVAAWMGGMTIGFMGSTSITITNVDFVADVAGNTIVLDLKNTGTKTVTIASVRVNNQLVDATVPDWYGSGLNVTQSASLNAGEVFELTIAGPLGAWQTGNPYKVDLYDGANQVVGSAQQNSPGA